MYFLLDVAKAVASTTAETNSLLNSELFSALIGSCFTVIGVFIGNISARKTAKSQEEIRLLAEFYAEVFTEFSVAAPFTDSRKCLSFISSLEKASLLCSEESSKIITDLIRLVAKKDAPPDELSDLYVKLRESAKKDLRKC